MLIKTIAEIKAATDIHKNMAFDTIKPYIRRCERDYVLPILGDTQYDALTTAYENNALTTEQVRLLDEVQQALACYAVAAYLPDALVSIGDMGVMQQQGANTTPATKWATDEKLSTLWNNADRNADALVSFLDKNAGDYPLWSASTAFTELHELFISKLEIVQMYYPMNNKRTFLAFLPSFKAAENSVQPILGNVFDDLKAKLLTGGMSPEEKKLTALVQRTCVWFGLYSGLPFVQTQINANGLYITSYNNTTKREDAAQMAMLRTTFLSESDKARTEMATYLKSNPTAFPNQPQPINTAAMQGASHLYRTPGAAGFL